MHSQAHLNSTLSVDGKLLQQQKLKTEQLQWRSREKKNWKMREKKIMWKRQKEQNLIINAE